MDRPQRRPYLGKPWGIVDRPTRRRPLGQAWGDCGPASAAAFPGTCTQMEEINYTDCYEFIVFGVLWKLANVRKSNITEGPGFLENPEIPGNLRILKFLEGVSVALPPPVVVVFGGGGGGEWLADTFWGRAAPWHC